MKKIILAIILISSCFFGFTQESGEKKPNDFKQTSNNSIAELKVYPNPCKQEKVTIESNSNNVSDISITNIAGKQVYQKEYIIPENKIQVEVSEMPNGIYLVKIKTSEGKQIVKKLIVSKG